MLRRPATTSHVVHSWKKTGRLALPDAVERSFLNTVAANVQTLAFDALRRRSPRSWLAQRHHARPPELESYFFPQVSWTSTHSRAYLPAARPRAHHMKHATEAEIGCAVRTARAF